RLAGELGLSRGSVLPLSTARGLKTLTVRGILDPGGAASAFGGALLLMDIDAVRFNFGREGKVDRIDIRLENAAAAEEVEPEIASILEPGMSLSRPEAGGGANEKVLEVFQLILFLQGLLALL